MAKRSYIQAIKTKQSSAYRSERTSAQAIHRIDGSSQREASRSRTKALKSWIEPRGLSKDELDRIADQQINQLLYGSKIKPRKVRESICSDCFTMKSRSGSCNC